MTPEQEERLAILINGYDPEEHTIVNKFLVDIFTTLRDADDDQSDLDLTKELLLMTYEMLEMIQWSKDNKVFLN